MGGEHYVSTIGLEIHAELKTKTKMFCGSRNDPDEKRPNVNVCPICLGHPGTLPVINKEAVRHVLRVGLAVGGELADFTEFDRKNYFYPDIPRGYQLSQYQYPLVKGGILAGVKFTRIHLEEDTGTSLHERGDYSLVDFNRAGVPLMELVTEPVIHSAKEAVNFARELQLLLRYLNVSDANMEKGEMRVEANISIQKSDVRYHLVSDIRNPKLGTKVEVKNLNSFKAVERAIEYEVKRQTWVLQGGGRVAQETRGFDEVTGETFPERHKEESHDYRYFPDPDLPKLKISEISEFGVKKLKENWPELPAEKRQLYSQEFGLKSQDIEIFVRNRPLGAFFEAATRMIPDKNLIKLAANYTTSDLVGLLKAASITGEERELGFDLKVLPDDFRELIVMVGEGELSSRAAKDILKILLKKGGQPRKIADDFLLLQKNDQSVLADVVKHVIEDNPDVVNDVRAGKKSAVEFLVGQGMKATRGSANPRVLREILEKQTGVS